MRNITGVMVSIKYCTHGLGSAVGCDGIGVASTRIVSVCGQS